MRHLSTLQTIVLAGLMITSTGSTLHYVPALDGAVAQLLSAAEADSLGRARMPCWEITGLDMYPGTCWRRMLLTPVPLFVRWRLASTCSFAAALAFYER